MKLRNIGKNAFIVDRIETGPKKFVHQVIQPGGVDEVEGKKAEKLLRQYPYVFVKDSMLVSKPSEFEAAKAAAQKKPAPKEAPADDEESEKAAAKA